MEDDQISIPMLIGCAIVGLCIYGLVLFLLWDWLLGK